MDKKEFLNGDVRDTVGRERGRYEIKDSRREASVVGGNPSNRKRMHS